MFVEDRSHAKKLFDMVAAGGTITNKDGNIVFTPKDGADVVLFTQSQLMGKSTKVEIGENTEYKKTLKGFEISNDGTKVEKFETGPLNAKKVEVKLNPNNDEFNQRVDIDTYDYDGVRTIVTSDNLVGTKTFTGIELYGKDDIVKTIANTKKGDLYLNEETGEFYRRTDKDGFEDRWEYKATLKGDNAISDVEEWLKDNPDKTRQDYFDMIIGRYGSNYREKKPEITDEDVYFNRMYIYPKTSYIYFEVDLKITQLVNTLLE